MAGCSCGADKKSAAEKILGLAVCTKTHQCFVTCIVEKALPILFWLAILGSFIAAFKAANIVFGVGTVILTFFTVLIGSIIFTFISFYLIYLLKAINDALKKDKDSCGCGCEDGAEVKKEENITVKKRGRKPKVTA
ncbi:MAG: hypothetical protein LBP54_01140 [Campylobacteraceae bacterium]|jgi:membrane protein implicated in regulation of membrane protease activity|nr:hypothetical protein [Campylobacteraceae bacterium]